MYPRVTARKGNPCPHQLARLRHASGAILRWPCAVQLCLHAWYANLTCSCIAGPHASSSGVTRMATRRDGAGSQLLHCRGTLCPIVDAAPPGHIRSFAATIVTFVLVFVPIPHRVGKAPVQPCISPGLPVQRGDEQATEDNAMNGIGHHFKNEKSGKEDVANGSGF